LKNRGGSEYKEKKIERPEVSLQDELRLYGIGEDKRVGDVIETESEILCYRYPAA